MSNIYSICASSNLYYKSLLYQTSEKLNNLDEFLLIVTNRIKILNKTREVKRTNSQKITLTAANSYK